MNKSATVTGVLGLFLGLVIGAFFLASDQETSTSENGVDATASGQAENDVVRWKMASSLSSTLPVAGTGGISVQERIRVLSEGKMELKFYDPSALVPPLEVLTRYRQVQSTQDGQIPDSGRERFPRCSFLRRYHLVPEPVKHWLGCITVAAWN